MDNDHEYEAFEFVVEPDSSIQSSTESAKPSFFKPDPVIVKHKSDAINLGDFRLDRNADRTASVIEVTSVGRPREKNVRMEKKHYAKKGIPEYIIIDTNKVLEGRRDSYVPDPKLCVFKLNCKEEYVGKVYRGAEKMRFRFFYSMATKDMLTPASSYKTSREKQQKLLKEHREELRGKDEDLNAIREEFRLEKEKNSVSQKETAAAKKREERLLFEIDSLRGKRRKKSDTEVNN